MNETPALLPPRLDALPLSVRGSSGVGVKTLELFDDSRNRPLKVEVWYPADLPSDADERTIYANIPWLGTRKPVSFAGRALRGATPRPDKAPVVIYAHGAPGSRLQSTRLCEHLASHGFVVAAIDFTYMTYGDRSEEAYVTGLLDRPQDVSFTLDTLATSETFGDIADVANAAIIGYSFGGYTAIAACGAGLDFESLAAVAERGDNIGYVLGFRDRLEPLRGKQRGFVGDQRLKAAFVMAPWNAPILDLPQVSVPVFVAVGELDVIAPMKRDAERIYEGVASDEVSFMMFERGGHNIFTDPCLPEVRATLPGWEHCADPVWDKERSGDIIKHVALAFMQKHLLAREAAVEQLRPTALGALPGVTFKVR